MEYGRDIDLIMKHTQSSLFLVVFLCSKSLIVLSVSCESFRIYDRFFPTHSFNPIIERKQNGF